MTIRVAWWVAEKEKEGMEYAIGRPMNEWNPGRPGVFLPAVGIPLIAQSAALAIGGHWQIAKFGHRLEKYGKLTHKLTFPGVGASFKETFKITKKNKWLLRGARFGGRVIPGVNMAILAYDVYTVAQWARN